jgi:hypothetical protein
VTQRYTTRTIVVSLLAKRDFLTDSLDDEHNSFELKVLAFTVTSP